MEPIYIAGKFALTLDVTDDVPWLTRTSARRECFMALTPSSYTYGSGTGIRTYESVEMAPWVRDVMAELGEDYNVCFLNRYDSEGDALGWHSDDSDGTDLTHPIAVISIGEPREIWWRKRGTPGIVPAECRRLLESGSLFVMPAGFQKDNEHRIPKGSRAMGRRVSLTFRRYLTSAVF
jgi:alkylated DNA repair dioxygenase AlkB